MKMTPMKTLDPHENKEILSKGRKLGRFYSEGFPSSIRIDILYIIIVDIVSVGVNSAV